MPALPLTPEQQEDAARLKKAFNSWKLTEKEAGRPANQAAAAAAIGIGQSAFSQYCNGDIPLNVKILVDMRETLGFDPASISPTLAREIARVATAVGGNTSDLVLSEDHAPVLYVDAKASAGKGEIVFSDDVSKTLMFRRDWLAKNDAKPDSTIAFEVDGNSMVDMHIVHGAVVLANRKKTDPISKRVYIIWIDGELYVKQLIKKDGMWWARSHNTSHKDDFPDIPITSMDDRIVGKAFWCGFGL